MKPNANPSVNCLTMKLVILMLFVPISLFAQQWQTIPHEHYNLTNYTGGYVPSTNYSQFEINPFDGTMWFLNNVSFNNFDVKRINPDGNLVIFDSSNNPYMDNNSRYNYGVSFINSSAYVLHGFDGVFKCDDITWSVVASGISGGLNICSDADSIYAARQSQDFLTVKDGIIGFENISIFKRIQSRNGNLWGSGSNSSSIAKYLPSLSTIQPFYPDSCDLLDNSNHDFKFARNSDTLYVAGQLGFSLAFEDQFVDSITMYNSSGMPYQSIIEFEFDSQDNIWAVFGEGGVQGFHPIFIGYFNRVTSSWSMIYDNTNSPIDFSKRIDIEIDLNDNLWVCDRSDLHVLKINSSPGWLSLIESEQQSLCIYPNPSKGTVSIELAKGQQFDQIQITDVNGSVLNTFLMLEDLNLDLACGTYFVQLINENMVIATEKLIIQ